MSETNKVTIIGSGPGGYTAAIYAARANLHPTIFAGGPSEHDPARVPGGQLMITTEVENYPGFPEGIHGPELMERFKKQVERFDGKILMENVVSLDLSKRPFHLKGESQELFSETVILATGASANWLKVKGENEYKNRGVSACATCDGFFFRNQEVLVVGGGDTAMEEATYLANLVKKVTLVHRRHEFRASKIMADRVLKNPKISVVWDSKIDEVIGDGKVMTGAILHNVKTQEKTRLDAAGMFVAIGHTPNVELVRGVLELHPNGYVKVKPGTTYTNLDGVFACGDVADAHYRQAVTAAGTGCMAAIDAERWLTEKGL